MDTDEVLALLRRVAAEVVEPRFGALAEGEVESKGRPHDLVTVADREAEVLIAAELRRAWPSAVVLGEEAASADPSLLRGWADAPHAFTVDPVDGTRQFVAGSPDHATMVAELRSGEVVRSWIWQPQHRTAYVAERGAGAWRDGVRLQVRPGRARRLRGTATCCGIDYPRLAQGEAGWTVWPKTKPWDHAPGSLLLTEAGGWVGSPTGRAYRPGAPPRVLVARAARPS
ncbi:inositol monophosphatase family protein [Nocardioides litoris]|uniref:inositol monophosphatase family protein n=1 Tax=Nocardioides litoris TaxID=1926648 RepID=UPI001122F5FB|nr:inositol monophosphatase [Nocardioides litoris]